LILKLRGESRYGVVADLEQLVNRAFADCHVVVEAVVAVVMILDDVDANQDWLDFIAQYGNALEPLVCCGPQVDLVHGHSLSLSDHQVQEHL